MSTEFQNVVSLCLHTCVDLFAGLAISKPLGTFFSMKAHDPPATDFFKLTISILTQACITMVAGDSLRKLIWSDPAMDPTGGIVFVLALWQQPIFWTKIEELWALIITNFGTSSNDDSTPTQQ